MSLDLIIVFSQVRQLTDRATIYVRVGDGRWKYISNNCPFDNGSYVIQQIQKYGQLKFYLKIKSV